MPNPLERLEEFLNSHYDDQGKDKPDTMEAVITLFVDGMYLLRSKGYSIEDATDALERAHLCFEHEVYKD
tara:strand:- start:10064 stop:10273 length:210 start_codon:yes stop_codon:yes gene_type:complete